MQIRTWYEHLPPDAKSPCEQLDTLWRVPAGANAPPDSVHLIALPEKNLREARIISSRVISALSYVPFCLAQATSSPIDTQTMKSPSPAEFGDDFA
jgi:hypothetical protein